MSKASFKKCREALEDILRGGLWSTNHSIVRWPYFSFSNKEVTREGTRYI